MMNKDEMDKISDVEVVDQMLVEMLAATKVTLSKEEYASVHSDLLSAYLGWFVEGSLPMQPDIMIETANGIQGLVTNYGPTRITASIVETFLDVVDYQALDPIFLALELIVFKHLPVAE